MSVRDIVLLLGRPDSPTDGVADHSRYLEHALRAQGREVATLRLPVDDGRAALLQAARQASRFRPGAWFVVQYTALSWSASALPVHVPALVRALKSEGARVAIAFHDLRPYSGARPQDRVRRWVQRRTMLQLGKMTDACITPIPPERVEWIPSDVAKRFTMIPIGANVKEGRVGPRLPPWVTHPEKVRTVGVFGIVNDERRSADVSLIRELVVRLHRESAVPLRVRAIGRGTREAEALLREALAPLGVDVQVDGIVPSDSLINALSSLDALLFVRGPVTGQRGSALAAAAAGVPIVGYAGHDTAPPVTTLGAVFVSEGDLAAFAARLREVLTDEKTWLALHAQNARAFETAFSWSAIARTWDQVLR